MQSGLKGLFALFVAFLAVLPTRSLAIPGDQNWDEHFHRTPGVNGAVYGMAFRDGNLYVAGDFTQAGSVEARSIARWDGTNWFSLGEGISGRVSSLAFFGTNLYAGGVFDQAGETTATNIAMWDGAEWHNVGGGTGPADSFPFFSMISCLMATEGGLYAAGSFSTIGGVAASSVAKWDGTTWTNIGEGISLVGIYEFSGEKFTNIMSGYVFSMSYADGDLFVGGIFNHAGSIYATNIARWNGTNWNNLGNGVNGGPAFMIDGEIYSGSVEAIESFQGNLYVGGQFKNAGGLAVTNLAKWDGTSWHDAGGEFTDGGVGSLLSLNGELWVSGRFPSVDGKDIKNIAKWDGEEWHGLGSGINGGVARICADGNRVFACGDFGIAGGKPAAFVAEWDGLNWSALEQGTGNSIIGTVRSLAIASGNVYAAGALSSAGTNEANFLVSWDGVDWAVLDRDFIGSAVNSMAAVSNKLYVSGDFRLPDHGITNLAAWDGTNWTGFGVESGTSIDHIVTSGNNIYVSGWFSSIGGVPANNLAVWNGTNWSDLANGFSPNPHYFNPIFATENALYVSTYSRIDQWDGTNWSQVGDLVGTNTFPPTIESMTSFRGQIIVTANSYPDSYLMKWDGTNWLRIDHPFAPGFLRIVGSENYLYGYGPMTNGNGDVSYNVSKWDGLNWFPLASGVTKQNGSFYGLVSACDENTLAVAGNFTMAGGKDSYHFGIWHEPPLPFISQSRKLGDGSFTFRVLGSEGQKVEIQSSDDFLDWNSFQTNSLNSLPLEIIDPFKSVSQQFYRLKQVP